MRATARGFTLLELLVVLGMSTLLIGIAATNLGSLISPLQTGSAQTLSFFKQVRARALSSTSAYVIVPASATQLVTQFAATCSAASFTTDPSLSLELPLGTSLASTSWSLCFTSRGLADQNLLIGISDGGGESRTIEVVLGGSSRIVGS